MKPKLESLSTPPTGQITGSYARSPNTPCPKAAVAPLPQGCDRAISKYNFINNKTSVVPQAFHKRLERVWVALALDG